jgi:hypothetical protein
VTQIIIIALLLALGAMLFGGTYVLVELRARLPDACDTFHPARAPEGLTVMVEQGVLTSIWLQRGSTLKTDRGFGVGDTATAIKAAYGPLAYAAAQIPPHQPNITTRSVGGAAYVRTPRPGASLHRHGRRRSVAAGGQHPVRRRLRRIRNRFIRRFLKRPAVLSWRGRKEMMTVLS